MSWVPSKFAEPVAGTRPVRASMMVVLPAPLGPMRKRRSDWKTVRSTPSTALKPSKETRQSADLEIVRGHQIATFCSAASTRSGRSGGGVASGADRVWRTRSRTERKDATPPGRKATTSMNMAPWK